MTYTSGTKRDALNYENKQIEMIKTIVEHEKKETDWTEKQLRNYWERQPLWKLAEAYKIRSKK